MKLKYMSVAIAALFSVGGTVSAQQSPAAPPTTAKADDSEKVEGVIVTARRREELIHDVPGSVTAFCGSALKKAGTADNTALA